MKLHKFLLPGAALFCLLALLLLPEEGAQAARDALANDFDVDAFVFGDLCHLRRDDAELGGLHLG